MFTETGHASQVVAEPVTHCSHVAGDRDRLSSACAGSIPLGGGGHILDVWSRTKYGRFLK